MRIRKIDKPPYVSFLLFLGVFCFTFIFFTQAHPVYPYDADDWTYLYEAREFCPDPQEYNPTRILPEVLMPISGMFAMCCIFPLTHDVTIAVSLSTGLILAFFIALYLCMFHNMILRRFRLGGSITTLLSLLFLAFHFLFYRTSEHSNQHLFYSFDLCCHYNYTIPNLLAGSMVFLFMKRGYTYFSLQDHTLRKGILLTILYTTLLSHVFGSIILTAYLSAEVLIQLIHARRDKLTILDVMNKYRLHISLVVFWLVTLLWFEATGRRADAVSSTTQNSFSDALYDSLRYLYIMIIKSSNRMATGLIVITIATYLTHQYHHQEEMQRDSSILPLILSLIISGIYLLLMCAKSYPYYMLRSMTVFAVPFFLILMMMVCAAYLLNRIRTLSAMLPFLLLFVSSNCVRKGNTFLDVQTLQIEQEVQGIYDVPLTHILRQNQSFINQIVETDNQGEDSLSLIVPHYDHVDNWPIAYYYGKRLSRFLYKYGLTSQPVKVTISTEQDIYGE